MLRVRTACEAAVCGAAWAALMPQDLITDLWEVRACFHRHFKRPLSFVIAEGDSGPEGLLPLCYVEEAECYSYWPGETWAGHTWLEGNRIPATTGTALRAVLTMAPRPHHIRYLLPLPEGWPDDEPREDEVGYLFSPPRYDFDIERYFAQFRHKTAKAVKREVATLEALGVEYRHDCLTDFEELIRLNVSRFGDQSYYADSRFVESFRDLMHWLFERGWLRLTTVLLAGQVAAVDMGCIYREVYTLLAGGTNADFVGVAKLINLHHMAYACERRLQQVDFLCGDFSWKTLFHLEPRPLYVLDSAAAEEASLR